jgi:hypothetical protein
MLAGAGVSKPSSADLEAFASLVKRKAVVGLLIAVTNNGCLCRFVSLVEIAALRLELIREMCAISGWILEQPGYNKELDRQPW